LNIGNKNTSLLPIWCYVKNTKQPVHLHTFNEEDLIWAKFYINDVLSIGN